MKMKLLVSVLFCSLCANVYAGEMGPVSTTEYSTILPFVTLEGDYAWNSMYPGVINGIQSVKKNSPWGGRAAGGFALKRTENLFFSGEAGWGAYGHNNLLTTSGESASYYFYGFDLLLGATYFYQQFDVFAKAGAMIETLRGISNTTLGEYDPGSILSGYVSESSSQTTALPEVKIGGEYNFNSQLAVSLAYMYVFGSNQKLFVDNKVTSGQGLARNQQLRFQGPSLNSIMLGLRYYI